MSDRYPRFTLSQQTAIKKMLNVPAPSTRFRTEYDRLAISELERVLQLPPMPYRRFLGSDSWLMGGSVLKWLSGLPLDTLPGDFDFFFSSLDALNRTAKALIQDGATVRGYRAFAQNIREYLRMEINSDRNSEIWDAAGNLVDLNQDLVTRLRLVYLELLSPNAHILQLVASCEHPNATNAVKSSDFTICQLVLDGEYLHFGSYTWNDIFRKRIRCENNRWPESSFRRLFRYGRRGFRPYASTALSLSFQTLAQALTYPLRYTARHWK